MLDFLRCFQWYRAWRGGTWYYVRGIYDLGRTVLYELTRRPLPHEVVLQTESY